MHPYSIYVKTELGRILRSLRIDVEFERGEGDNLEYTGEDGETVQVLDLVGGYGTLLFGHNHPEIVAEARAVLDSKMPFHAQFSMKPAAGRLAETLDRIVRGETGHEGRFMSVFANSGAEAVEAAVKHAEFERVKRLEEIGKDLAFEMERARMVAHGLEPKDFLGSWSELPDRYRAAAEATDGREMLARIEAANAEALAGRPFLVCLERSFHGKLVGSVQMTFGLQFRQPFRGLGLDVRFVRSGNASALRELIEEAADVVVVPQWDGGNLRLRIERVPLCIAMFLEPLQGEGGVHWVDEEFAREARRFCNLAGCPLVLDEIQSGMGRTGTFLASSQIGVRGDYYLFSKALGGGIAKISALLVHESRYCKEFNLIHSSTFAEDEYSSRIALKALELVERDGFALLQRIRRTSGRLVEGMEALRTAFPDVVEDVRGRGLFLGFEFRKELLDDSIVIRSAQYNRSLGYFLAGYLFRRHRIRVAPTGSAPNVLRFEPSAFLSDADVDRVLEALHDLCRILRNADAFHLAFVFSGAARPLPRIEVLDHRRTSAPTPSGSRPPKRADNVRKVAFLNHLISPEWLSQADPSLEGLTFAEKEAFLRNLEMQASCAPFPPVRISSALGVEVDFILYPMSTTSERMVEALLGDGLRKIRDDIDDRLLAAISDGCTIAGLGMYTSIVTNNAQSIRIPGISLTTGNSLTVAMGIQAVEKAVRESQGRLAEMRLAVVGAAGNIASTYAALLAEQVGSLALIGSGREDSRLRLGKTAAGICEALWELAQSPPQVGEGRLAAEFRECEPVRRLLLDPTLSEGRPGEWIQHELQQRYGSNPFIEIRSGEVSLRDAEVVLCAANADRPFLHPDQFRPGAVVCDIAVPNNCHRDLFEADDRFVYFQGGVVATPHGDSLPPTARATLGPGQVFACMAETILLGLSGIEEHFSYGPLAREKVKMIAGLARLHGFQLAELKLAPSL